MDAVTKSTFKLIFVTLLFDLLAFALILPLLPKILDYYATTDRSHTYKLYEIFASKLQRLLDVPETHNQVLLAGLLGSWFSFLQFISSPFIGALSDKYGRRPLLLLASFGTILSYIIWFYSASNFALFVLSRTVGGLCKSNVGLSLAIISDVSDDKTRGKGMALVGSAFSLAFILGPIVGAYLATIMTNKSAYIVAQSDNLIVCPASLAITLSVISFSLVFCFLNETNKQTIIINKKSKEANIRSNFQRILYFINPNSLLQFALINDKHIDQRQKQVLKDSGLICFLYLLFFSGLEFTLSFLTHLKFGFKPVDQGYLYLFSGLLMSVIQGGYIRKASGALIASKMLVVGLGIIVPSFILMGLSTQVWHIYCALALYAVSSSIAVPCLTTIASLHSPASFRGTSMGTLRSIGSLARALGPCLAAAIFFTFGPNFCYIIGALALILPFIRMVKLYKKLQIKHNQNSKRNDCKIDSKMSNLANIMNNNNNEFNRNYEKLD